MKELARDTGVVEKKDKKPYKPNILGQALNVLSAYSYQQMRELYKINNEFTSPNVSKAKKIVIEQKKDLGPFFGLTQFISTRDLVRKSE